MCYMSTVVKEPRLHSLLKSLRPFGDLSACSRSTYSSAARFYCDINTFLILILKY